MQEQLDAFAHYYNTIRPLDLDTGELIRQLTLDPSRDYQPIGGG